MLYDKFFFICRIKSSFFIQHTNLNLSIVYDEFLLASPYRTALYEDFLLRLGFGIGASYLRLLYLEDGALQKFILVDKKFEFSQFR